MICIVFILSLFSLLLLKFNNGFEFFIDLSSGKENILNIMPLNINASLEAYFHFLNKIKFQELSSC